MEKRTIGWAALLPRPSCLDSLDVGKDEDDDDASFPDLPGIDVADNQRRPFFHPSLILLTFQGPSLYELYVACLQQSSHLWFQAFFFRVLELHQHHFVDATVHREKTPFHFTSMSGAFSLFSFVYYGLVELPSQAT